VFMCVCVTCVCRRVCEKRFTARTPLHHTHTHHTHTYSHCFSRTRTDTHTHIHTHATPSHTHTRTRAHTQSMVDRLGGTSCTIFLLSSNNRRTVYEAMRTLYTLLDAGNPDVQRTVLRAIDHGLSGLTSSSGMCVVCDVVCDVGMRV